MFHTPVEAISGGKSQYYYYKELDSIVRRIGKVLFNETVINPPAELGRLTDARGGEQSTQIENSAV